MQLRYSLLFPFLISCQMDYKVSSIGDIEAGNVDLGDICEPLEEQLEDDKAPVAVCSASVTETAPIFGSVNFLGRDSYDPNGYSIVSYNWSIIDKPEGSSAELGMGIADRMDFQPDLAGSYTMQLVVENDRCLISDPCTVTVDAIPSENLWVEMHWEHAGDDMDLHLTQNNGAYESQDDCYYGNCIPDSYGSMLEWGQSGEMDNPRLDLDDVDGVGPENINIVEPAAGLYTVAVHDFPGSVYEGENRVTVRIHLDGTVVYEGSKIISGEDTYVPFAMVEWPSKLIQAIE